MLELWHIIHFYAVIRSRWESSHRRFEHLKRDCWFVCSTTNPLIAHIGAFMKVWSCKHPEQSRPPISWEHQTFQAFRVSSHCPESLCLLESVLEEEEEPDQPMPDPALDRTDETFLVPKSLHQMWEKHKKATYYSMSPMMMYELEFSPDLLCPCFQLCIHCTESSPLKLSQVPELFC